MKIFTTRFLLFLTHALCVQVHFWCDWRLYFHYCVYQTLYVDRVEVKIRKPQERELYLLFLFVCCCHFGGEGTICCLHPQCQSQSHYCRGHKHNTAGKPSLNRLLRSHFHQDKGKIIHLRLVSPIFQGELYDLRMCFPALLWIKWNQNFSGGIFCPSCNLSPQPHG